MSFLKDCCPQVKVAIINRKSQERGGFGQGSARLLRGVAEYGSLNMAAKKQDMAYSKAWRLIRDVEKIFGVQLLNRNGARGSTLTKDGVRLLALFDELVESTCRHASEEFDALRRSEK